MVFTRKYGLWSPDKWEEGSIDQGRFRVYFPDHPGSDVYGRVDRARVVWWIETNGDDPAQRGYDIHHKNLNKLDDRFENLMLLTRGDHVAFHKSKELIICICQNCKEDFAISQWRVDEGRGKFCSLECYRDYPRPLRGSYIKKVKVLA